MSDKKLIVVAGPTAVGKTSVSIQLAQHFQTSIVSADSRQVYREMTVGTAKPSPSEQASVRHYFIGTHSVGQDYDAATYAADALTVIHDLFRQNDKVILCGGSGLYLKGVCEGFDDMPVVPQEIRRDLMVNYRRRGIEWLQEKMRELDPEAWRSLDPHNPHRLIRALEVKLHSGKSILSFRKNEKREHGFDIIKIGLDLPRQELYQRIDARMDDMIAHGLFEEARRLYPLRDNSALQTVGYQEIFGFIDNEYDLAECVRLLKRNSRRYAKRQLTWFRKDPEFTWFHPLHVEAMLRYIEDVEV
ncbi:MAG: tRNA (adenosine(37)-N6)-dimethylallyltransferase MiaA [Cyclobacteriaceae bacterium]